MAISNPRITFLFPYRWLTDDRQFLAENLKRQVIQQAGKHQEDRDYLQNILSYRVEVFCFHYMPMKVDLSKAFVQKALKDLFPNARCLNVETTYEQNKDRESLPMMDFRIFF